MEDLSLHILDVVQNSILAGATRIRITFTVDEENSLLTLVIEDNGRGMSSDEMEKARDPFFTTKKGKRIGMGLPLLSQAAEQTGGDLQLSSEAGTGTRVTARFHTDHIDMIPLGDLNTTLKVLVNAHPDINVDLDFKKA